MKIRAWGLPLLGLFSACSSSLYHPSHRLYYEPEKNGYTHEDVRFTSTAGAPLDGWYFHTPERKTPRAQIVFFHGNGSNLTNSYATLIWLLDYGFDFFIFDYEGYGESPGKPSPEKTVQDGVAAIRYLANRNPDIPLIVFAQSLGGAVALRTLIELHHEIPVKLIVIDSSFLSYIAAGKSVLAKSWTTWLSQPLANLVLTDEWAPGDRVKELGPTPLLVIHGDRDQVIDYELGVDLFNRAEGPKEFWRIDGGHHCDALWGYHGVYRIKLLEKFEQILR